jgi:putative ABC transport system permease protein
MLDTVWQDVRFGARSLRRSPGFTVAAVLTLALGIGANAAIFSVLDAVVLRPLPYADPARLVAVWNRWTDTPQAPISAIEYFDYREGLRSFEHFGVTAGGAMTLTGAGEPVRIPIGAVSHGVLPALGVAPQHGRFFTAQEDTPGRNSVVLLSDELWRRRFAADPNVVGRRVVLSRAPYTVVGVMPAGFRLPRDFDSSAPAEAFVPLGFDRTTIPIRGNHFLTGVGRLRPGVSPAQAAAEIETFAERMAAEMPQDYPASLRFSATAIPLTDNLLGDLQPMLLTLLGAVGFVLLIACANITHLFLTRTERRHQELAVRAALGGGPWRMARPVIAESALVALGGGLLGLLCARAGTDALVALQPGALPRLDIATFDREVLIFTVAAVAAVTVLVSLVPAFRTARTRVATSDAATTVTSAPGRQRVRRVLVASEVALSLVLLLGAGLTIRSFFRLLSVDPGFSTERLLTATITVPESVYPTPDATSNFFASLLARLRAQPGVVDAGAVTGLPLVSARGDLNFQIEGRETPQGALSRRADWQVVTPGYFQAIGMRIVRGRGIEASDRAGTSGVIVFNESAARLHWPDGDALGARLKLGGNAGPGWVTVVGIVNDVRTGSLRDAPRPEMYLAHTQFRMFGRGTDPVRTMSVVLQARDAAAPLADTLRREVAALDPALAVDRVQTMETVRRLSVARLEFVTTLLGVFAGLALTVALVGVYGVMAYSVASRRREIGLRAALGASPRRVASLVLRQALTPAAAGIAAGLAGGILASRLLAEQLFEVAPHDPTTAALTASIVAAVALLACYVPARRAARLNPSSALRSE